jgi:UDP-N-acetylmuramate: L-alanyl-gamma-D-glutamyl-meso-diaminopimelate ligase
MRTVHFIAIGGSAMHNLAIALHQKGFEVTGSDDEIFEPSRSRLDRLGLLPEKLGWDPLRIHKRHRCGDPGHARPRGQSRTGAGAGVGHPGVQLSLVLPRADEGQDPCGDRRQPWQDHHHQHDHPRAAACGVEFDYLVGAQLEGFDCMVR